MSDTDPGWIELDFQVSGRVRYTFWNPNGEDKTLIRWDWMGDEAWKQKKAEFIALNPNAPIRTRDGKPVDTDHDRIKGEL